MQAPQIYGSTRVIGSQKLINSRLRLHNSSFLNDITPGKIYKALIKKGNYDVYKKIGIIYGYNSSDVINDTPKHKYVVTGEKYCKTMAKKPIRTIRNENTITNMNSIYSLFNNYSTETTERELKTILSRCDKKIFKAYVDNYASRLDTSHPDSTRTDEYLYKIAAHIVVKGINYQNICLTDHGFWGYLSGVSFVNIYSLL